MKRQSKDRVRNTDEPYLSLGVKLIVCLLIMYLIVIWLSTLSEIARFTLVTMLIIGFIYSIVLISLIIGLIVRSNIARISTMVIFGLLILYDICQLLNYEISLHLSIGKILFLSVIIWYLSSYKVMGVFRRLN